MKHRADVLSLGAALLFALAAALVGPLGDSEPQVTREPEYALLTPNPSRAPLYRLSPADALVYLLLEFAPDYPPTEEHVFTLR